MIRWVLLAAVIGVIAWVIGSALKEMRASRGSSGTITAPTTGGGGGGGDGTGGRGKDRHGGRPVEPL